MPQPESQLEDPWKRWLTRSRPEMAATSPYTMHVLHEENIPVQVFSITLNSLNYQAQQLASKPKGLCAAVRPPPMNPLLRPPPCSPPPLPPPSKDPPPLAANPQLPRAKLENSAPYARYFGGRLFFQELYCTDKITLQTNSNLGPGDQLCRDFLLLRPDKSRSRRWRGDSVQRHQASLHVQLKAALPDCRLAMLAPCPSAPWASPPPTPQPWQHRQQSYLKTVDPLCGFRPLAWVCMDPGMDPYLDP